MLFSSRLAIAVGFSSASLTISAPLNERRITRLLKRNNPEEGWLCHYDGPSNPDVDTSLDLPSMIEGLCAKVKYAYIGCENFHSKAPKVVEPIVAVTAATVPQNIDPPVCPGSDGTSTLSVCINLPPGPDGSDAEPAPNPIQAQSFSQDAGDDHHQHRGTNKPKGPKKHHKAPHAAKTDPEDEQLPPQSFNESPSPSPPAKQDVADHKDDSQPEPPKSDNSNKSQPEQEQPQPEQEQPQPQQEQPQPEQEQPQSSPSSFASQSADDSAPAAEQCPNGQSFSSQAGHCVDNSFFSKPNEDSSCKKGELDIAIHLCIDISLLGVNPTTPTDSVSPVNAAGLQPESTPEETKSDHSDDSHNNDHSDVTDPSTLCPSGQQFSALVTACVDSHLFAAPSDGSTCQSGWGLEPILGQCLDLLSCKEKSHSLLK